MARIMEERYTVVVNRLKEKKPLLEYIAKRLLEKETIDKQEFEDIIKAESQLPRQPALEAAETALAAAHKPDESEASTAADNSTDSTITPQE